jgi:hypothetical protein
MLFDTTSSRLPEWGQEKRIFEQEPALCQPIIQVRFTSILARAATAAYKKRPVSSLRREVQIQAGHRKAAKE